MNIEGKKECIINDKPEELMNLYECIKYQEDEFLSKLIAVNYN